MKIKNLKYILVFSFFALYLLSSSAFSDNSCASHPSSGTGDHPVGGDATSSGGCRSHETNQNSNSWYNNSTTLSEGANLFLKMIDKSRVQCNHENVVQIQTKMQQIGPACSVCIDGKAGKITRNTMASESCHELVCPAPLQVPRLDGNTLTCENEDYEIKNVGVGGAYCCEEIEVSISGPEISNGGWNGDTMEGVNVSFHIEGYTSSMSVSIDDSKISVEGGTVTPDPEGEVDENGYVDYMFDVFVPDDTATINIAEGVVNVGNKKSSAGTHSITKQETENPDCEKAPNGPDGDDCTSYGDSYTYSSEENCCVTTCDNPLNPGGTCENGFTRDGVCCVEVSCDKPAQNDSCANYGGIYYLDDYGCCVRGDACLGPDENDLCPEGYAPDSDGCCSLISVACGSGQVSQGGGACTGCVPGETVPNSTQTKCICDSSNKCCGIQLNTVVPFIGDCIELDSDSSNGDTTSVNSVTAFPILMQGLMKILMSVIMVFSFIMVIVAGLMMTAGAFKSQSFENGKTLLKNVIISLILLGCSGLILSLINPSFFGG